jgi:hypothetical protein
MPGIEAAEVRWDYEADFFYDLPDTCRFGGVDDTITQF